MNVDDLLTSRMPNHAFQWRWHAENEDRGDSLQDRCVLPATVFALLSGGVHSAGGGWRGYPTEDAAVAALADAVRRYKEANNQ